MHIVVKISKSNVVVLIASYNEEKNLKREISQIRKEGYDNILVSIDPKTSDDSQKILDSLGVDFVWSEKSGYDYVMKAGVSAIASNYPSSRAVLFSDAGNKTYYDIVELFIKKMNNGSEMVIGEREGGAKSMLWHQKLGTKLILIPIDIRFSRRIHDNGPLRLVTLDLLKRLDMKPRNFRWTTEMLVKALAIEAKIKFVRVRTKKRRGRSKISGSARNSLLAAFDMFTAFRFMFYQVK